MAEWLDRLKVAPQYCLPQHLLSRAVKRLSHSKNLFLKSLLIRQFLRAFDVNLEEALCTSANDFASFNALFTRKLRADARPVDQRDNIVCCPADGLLSQAGSIQAGEIIQAKGKYFSSNEILAEAGDSPSRYNNGFFATIYLAPNDYHRVHVPLDSKLLHVRYIPGDLFSVNARTARVVPKLFARNERVVLEFQSAEHGRIALVMIGALLVASIGLEFVDLEPLIYAKNTKEITSVPIEGAPLTVRKGQHLGWFNMGSTVVMLFEQANVALNDDLIIGQKVKMGQALGEFKE
ncbi:MAG: archaetidylserine decarboxylase [Pseudomonadota bacterium]